MEFMLMVFVAITIVSGALWFLCRWLDRRQQTMRYAKGIALAMPDVEEEKPNP